MCESRRIFGLTPGGYHRRGFADRVFANWSFADRVFANWPRLYNGLRMREVRSNGCSHQGQRCSPNDHEFQHRISCRPLAPSKPTTNPNGYYEAISRAQTSDRTVLFFDGCCRNSTQFRGLGCRFSSRCRSSRDVLQACFRRSTGKSGRSAPCRRDNCRRRFPTSFALPWQRGRKTRSQNRPSPRHRQPSSAAAMPER